MRIRIFILCMMAALAPISVLADSAGFGLRGVDLSLAGNTGPVSFVIYGSSLDNDTTYEVIDSGGTHFPATKAVLYNEWRAIATFNLSGAVEGMASVAAAKGTIHSHLENALSIGDGLTGQLETKLNTSNKIISGQMTTIFVSFSNSGNTDVDIPLMILSIPDASYLGTEPKGRNLGAYAMALGLPDGPIFTSIRPNESVTIPFYAIINNTGTSFATLSAIDPQSPTLADFPFDYDRLRNKTPDPTSQAVQDHINILQEDYGANFQDFYSLELAKFESLVNKSDHIYETVTHVDGRWQLKQIPPEPGDPRPTITGNPTPDVAPSSPSNPGSDGHQKTYTIIIGMGYSGRGYIVGPYGDSQNLYNFARYEMRTPDSQITAFFCKTPDGDEITKEDIKNAIINCGADGDDQLIIYYSGHGAQNDGSWIMPDLTTEINPSEIESWITEKNAGQTYLISDSCYSGHLVDKIHAPKTAVIAATTKSDPSYEIIGNGRGGYFTSVFLSLLKQDYSMEEAINKSIPIVYGSVKSDFGYKAKDQKPTYDPDGVDMQYPFGRISSYSLNSHSRELATDLDWAAELIEEFKDYEISPTVFWPSRTLIFEWAEEAHLLGIENINEYIDEKTEEWRLAQGDGVIRCISNMFDVTEAAASSSSFLPGGIAPSQHYHLFYVTDNQNGNIFMYNPFERQHRRITLIDGLIHPADIDIGDNGRSMVYVTNGAVQRKFFGLTAFITDTGGNPLSGAKVIVQSDLGEIIKTVDPDGYMTVMDLLKPSLFSRSLFLTVYHNGGSQLFSLVLQPTDQTFVKLEYSGMPGIIPPPTYASGTAAPPPGPYFIPGPGDGDTTLPPEPTPALVTPGQTTVAPDIPVSSSFGGSSTSASSSLPGGSTAAMPRIVILSPADGLLTSAAEHPFVGTVSDTGITSITLDINGVTQTIPISNKTFRQTITLTPGQNTIIASGINDRGIEAQSDPAVVTVDAGFPGDTGALTGRVMNGSGYPAQDIKIVEESTSSVTYTDMNGTYRFTGIPVGRVTLRVLP